MTSKASYFLAWFLILVVVELGAVHKKYRYALRGGGQAKSVLVCLGGGGQTQKVHTQKKKNIGTKTMILKNFSKNF